MHNPAQHYHPQQDIDHEVNNRGKWPALTKLAQSRDKERKNGSNDVSCRTLSCRATHGALHLNTFKNQPACGLPQTRGGLPADSDENGRRMATDALLFADQPPIPGSNLLNSRSAEVDSPANSTL